MPSAVVRQRVLRKSYAAGSDARALSRSHPVFGDPPVSHADELPHTGFRAGSPGPGCGCGLVHVPATELIHRHTSRRCSGKVCDLHWAIAALARVNGEPRTSGEESREPTASRRSATFGSRAAPA